jgi:hypothetical protein
LKKSEFLEILIKQNKLTNGNDDAHFSSMHAGEIFAFPKLGPIIVYAYLIESEIQGPYRSYASVD